MHVTICIFNRPYRNTNDKSFVLLLNGMQYLPETKTSLYSVQKLKKFE